MILIHICLMVSVVGYLLMIFHFGEMSLPVFDHFLIELFDFTVRC